MTPKNKKNDSGWHPLDNAGNLFPLISNNNFTNVFRVAVVLNETIDPELLQKALEETLPWFVHFQFRIRRGFFWNYFEKNNESSIRVEEEDGRPCRYIDAHKNKNYLFKVLYYKKRVSLEVFHALTDGTGAIGFLKALVVNYLHLCRNEKVQLDSKIVDVLSNVEDGYTKYYTKKPIETSPVKSSLKIKGRKLPVYEMGIIHGYLDLEQSIQLCKNKSVSLSVYLTSVYIWAIYNACSKGNKRFKPIQIAVPVNLRRFFDSNTTMNFFSYISASLLRESDQLTFDEVLSMVKEQFTEQISKENFAAKIGKDVALRRNVGIRITPLFIKNLFVRSIYLKSMRAYTSTLSNIGPVQLPEDLFEEVRQFEFLLNPTLSDPIKVGVVSYQNKLIVTFTSQLTSTDIQKEFFRKCSADGITVRIESNGVYYETM